MILAAGLLVGINTLTVQVVGFIALFILSGMGNGSVFKLIPSVFDARSHSLDVTEAERRRWSRAMSGALIGFCSAVGALGGVGINLALRESYLSSGTETSAYWMFLGSYLVAAILTWTMYVRKRISSPAGPPATKSESELTPV
ncbi:transporter%2C major facilitator family protein [Mycobacterium tuberculosis]|nr:transporter%2C major facilitator family protein [Mycobacterium tuberculosis]